MYPSPRVLDVRSHPARGRIRRARRCRSASARPSRRPRWGGWKIQFCQAVRRPKMRVSIVSGPAKAQVRLQAGHRVGREARALLQEDAHLVLPIDVVEGEGDEPEPRRRFARRAARRSLPRAASTASGSPRKRVCSRVRPFDIGIRPEIAFAERDRRGRRDCRPRTRPSSYSCGRRRTRSRRADPAKHEPFSISATSEREVRSMRFSTRFQ